MGKVKRQRDVIKDHFETGRSLTAGQASMLYDIGNLSTVVKQLEDEGYKVKREAYQTQDLNREIVERIKYSKDETTGKIEKGS